VYPLDLTIFSEMFKFARVDHPGDTRLSTVYELYVVRLESARLRSLAAARDQ
jgi:hypothetical protein